MYVQQTSTSFFHCHKDMHGVELYKEKEREKLVLWHHEPLIFTGIW